MRTWSIAGALLMAACADSGFVSIPDEGWNRNDTLTLAADSGHASRLVIRMERTYRYRDLWIDINGQECCIPVTRERGTGILQQTTDILPDDTVLRIVHRMRDTLLTGIVSIGVVTDGQPAYNEQ